MWKDELRMEKAIKNTFLEQMVAALPFAAAVVDQKKMLLACNNKWQVFLQQSNILDSSLNNGPEAKNLKLDNHYFWNEDYFSEAKTAVDKVLDGLAEELSLDVYFDRSSDGKWFKIIIKRYKEFVLLIFEDIDNYKNKEIELKKDKLWSDALFRSSSSAIVMLDKDYRIVKINNKFSDIFGYSLSEIKGENIDDLLDQNKSNSSDRENSRQVLNGQIVGTEGVRYSKNGMPRYFLIKGVPIIIEGKVEGAYGIYNDITEKKEAEEKLKIKEEQYRKIFNNSLIGIMLEDAEGNIIKVNDSFCRITGHTKEELEGRNIFEKLVSPQIEAEARANIERILSGEDLDFVLKTQKKSGEEYYAHIRETKVNISQVGEGILSMQIDVTKLKENEEKLRYISYHDNLTGVYNRHFFEEELKRLDTSRQLPISLIVLDANGLKKINDTYGHSVGDELLIKITRIVNSTIREEDIVARLGGDEFAIILPQTDAYAAEKIAARIKAKSSREKIRDFKISLAVGTAVKTNSEEDMYEIYNKADNKMYKDKMIS